MEEHKIEQNTCKYCSTQIPAGYFCCKQCWNDFEESSNCIEEEEEEEGDDD